MGPAAKDPIQLDDVTVTFVLDDVDTRGAATVFEIRVPAGGTFPRPHVHEGWDEAVYVLEGVFTFVVDGISQELGAGQAAFAERGQTHGVANTGGTDGVFLIVATPGVFRPAYFQELAKVLAASPGGRSDPDIGAIFGLMSRHGITPKIPGAPTAAG
jgi:quercetin dioxygenase-like cupin family protein